MTADTPVPVSADAAARERRDEMERPQCPAHNRTDCSPLLNGCGRLTAGFDREAARHDRDLIRGLKMTHTVSALLDQADALDAQVEALESERSVLAAKIEAARELIGRALLMHAAKAQPVDWQRWGRDVETFSSSFPREPDDIDTLRALAATEEPK